MRGLAAILAVAAAPALAQGVVPDPNVALPPGVDCLAPTGPEEERLCARAAWAEAEAERDVAYRLALTQAAAIDERMALEGTAGELTVREALELSQAAWFADRDATCAAEAILGRAAGDEALALHACLARLTRRRVEDMALFGAVE